MPSFLPLAAAAQSTLVASVLFLLVLSFLLAVFLHHDDPRKTLPCSSSAVSLADRHSDFFLSLSRNSSSSIAYHLRYLTSLPHLAGTRSSIHAHNYVLQHLISTGINSSSAELLPLLSFHLHSSLELLSQPPLFLPLSEPPHPHLPPSSPPYHAFSPSASLSAAPVYAHFARREDFLALDRLGVSVSGRIVLVRRGTTPRSSVISRAASLGAAAVLLFKPDAGDGVGRGGVERGTVLLGPGDPLTPGWAAVHGAERLPVDDEQVRRRFPPIPSMPIPAAAAQVVLKSLGGPAMPGDWLDGLQVEEGTSGVGPGSFLLNFTFKEEKKLATIRNVFGVIEGREEPDRYVILGNHRDAWTYGAVDPNSGTAVLLDVARRFGSLLRAGWRPRRTIILCSWDAEEFGMIGSTEWVEQNVANLGLKAVAYLNVDCAVQGPGFFASATPQLDKMLLEISTKVKDPDDDSMTLFQAWEKMDEGLKIGRLSRVDSDFSAFLHHAGIPSIDMYFGKDFPVYHTAFDSYEWMEKYGDPQFQRHVAMAEMWGLLALRLADSPVLPFDYGSYVHQLLKHMDATRDMSESQILSINGSIKEFAMAAMEVQMETHKLVDKDDMDGPTELRRRSLNDRLMHAERGFLEPSGLRGRPWFKHTVYSPSEDDESSGDAFPGVVDSVFRSKNTAIGDGKKDIDHEIWRVSRAIERVAHILRGRLF